MPIKQIDLPDIGLVTLLKKRGNNNIRMSFARDGSIRISLPFWVSYQAGINFARTRQNWITRHRPAKSLILQHKDRIGKAHRLVFNPTLITQKPTVRVSLNTITVSCPATLDITHRHIQTAAERGALRALKLEAEQLLPQRLEQLAIKYGFDFETVSVKRLSSRWGSCSQFKDITLNLFLMQLPWKLIDYVLLHELVHTEYLNHSVDFWKRFENVMPGAKMLRKELKSHRAVVLPMRFGV
ncbi:MAG: M48 family metallopeptidase [bacterium]|nr:M48 family metallopeptidase [bacterium]